MPPFLAGRTHHCDSATASIRPAVRREGNRCAKAERAAKAASPLHSVALALATWNAWDGSLSYPRTDAMQTWAWEVARGSFPHVSPWPLLAAPRQPAAHRRSSCPDGSRTSHAAAVAAPPRPRRLRAPGRPRLHVDDRRSALSREHREAAASVSFTRRP
jgi:hypothetical protein